LSCLCSILGELHSGGSLNGRGSSSRGSDRGGSGKGAQEGNSGEGSVAVVGSSDVLDSRGGNHGPGQQLSGGGDSGVGHGVGDDMGSGVGDLGHGIGGGGQSSVGVGDRGSDRGGSVGVGDRGGSVGVGDRGGSMGVLNRGDIGVLNRGNIGVLNRGSMSILNRGNIGVLNRGGMGVLNRGGMGVLNRGNMGVLNRGRGHNNGLADGVNKTVLVQVLREALKGQRAEALGGLDSIAKGRGQGAERDTLVDMGGGGSKGAGKDGRQDLQGMFR